MKYRPEIDGLRALAVVPVVLFHAGLDGFHGGYVGVDVFFVISGYLITTILLHDLDHGRFSLLKFYERRARRILPALIVVLVVTTIFALLWMHPNQLRNYADALLATSFFGSNFYFMSASSYFHSSTEIHPLLHTWSLAVEEQFYIVFPLLLWALFIWARLSLFWILTLLTVLSLIGSQVLLSFRPDFTFYMLPTRAWQLGAGVLCALWLSPGHRPGRLRQEGGDAVMIERPALALFGLLLIAGSVVFYDKSTPFPGFYALPPVLGSVFVILFAGQTGFASQFLRASPVVSIGLMSYSAYLWHQPLFAFARTRSFAPPSEALMLVLVGLTFVLAALSLRFIERPFRLSGPGISGKTPFGVRLSQTVILWGSAVALLLFAVFSFGLTRADGAFGRWSAKIPPGYNLYNKGRQETWEPLKAIDPSQWHAGGGGNHDWFSASDKPGLLLIGNSHSKDAYNIFAASDVARVSFAVGRVGVRNLNMTNLENLLASRAAREADILVLASRYSIAGLRTMPGLLDRLIQEDRPVALILNTAEFPSSDSQIADKKFMYTNILKESDSTEEIVARLNGAYHQFERLSVQALNVELRALAEARGITVLDRRDLMCDDVAKSCTIIGADFTKFLSDYGHPTLAGAAYYGSFADEIGWFAPLQDLAAN
ncbi:MAG: acyltransferase family protein [Tateyamaria sp.]|uniref:acyltransferase family protein n=1 Tax=Alphaproteobacteria TaxID=28211 RepID=UPI0032982CF1